MARPVPDQGWSWLVAIVAFINCFVGDGVLYIFGIFLTELMKSFDADQIWTVSAQALFLLVYYCTGTVISALHNVFGFRAIGVIGGICGVVGLFASSFAQDVYSFVAIFGIFTGFGCGIQYLTAMVILGFYFEKWFVLMTGLGSLGSPVSSFIYIIIFRKVVTDYSDWRSHYRNLSHTFLLSAGLTILVYRPANLEVEEEETKDCSGCMGDLKMALKKSVDLSLLRRPSFAIYAVSGMVTVLAYFSPLTFLVKRAEEELGFTKEESPNLLIVNYVANAIGRVVTGALCLIPNVDALSITMNSLLISGLSLMLSSHFESHIAQYILIGIFGFSSSTFGSLRTVIAKETYGTENLVSAFGIMQVFFGFGGLIGVMVAAALSEYQGSYIWAFNMCGILFAISAVMLLPMKKLADRETAILARSNA